MLFTRKHKIILFLLAIALVFLFFLNISLGSVTIPFLEIGKGILCQKMSKETWEIILFQFRLPKAISAILVGIALSISGLLMQTLFRNPLAGPYVLGLSSGASLGVALVILGAGFLPLSLATFLQSSFVLVLASGFGSALVLLAVLLVARKLKDTMAILIVGLMFGSFTNAFISVLSYFSTAEQLQKYTFWSMGSLANGSWNDVFLLTIIVSFGLFFSFLVIKPLNAILLGEKYASSIGIQISKTRNIILFATSILAGCVTAFVGPIAFIGLAVPHLAKLLFQTSNHAVLFWSCMLLGAITLLFCDIVAQLPGSDLLLPINAITSFIGAPVIISLLIRKKRM